jgi:predicted nucleotide-binding protein
MAQLPIEVLPANATCARRVKRAVHTANAVQAEFNFSPCGERGMVDVVSFAPVGNLVVPALFDSLETTRAASRGYHPFLLVFCDAYLVGKSLANLFGSHRAGNGLAIITFNGVDQILGDDDDAYTGYALYYMARYSMSFASPTIKNHDECRQCIFDRKINKHDIIESIRSGALCDQCRTAIWQSGKGSTAQMDAVDKLIDHASSLIHKTAIKRPPNVFIASSSKHLAYAAALKELLRNDFRVQVWNEDQVFRLGKATIEQLEEHVRYYDFGIFMMLPDDELRRGSECGMVPRDNVVFEAGLFTGKLSRSHAIIVTAQDSNLILPSDLKGLTTLNIDMTKPLPACLEAISQRAAGHIRYVFGEGIKV